MTVIKKRMRLANVTAILVNEDEKVERRVYLLKPRKKPGRYLDDIAEIEGGKAKPVTVEAYTLKEMMLETDLQDLLSVSKKTKIE